MSGHEGTQVCADCSIEKVRQRSGPEVLLDSVTMERPLSVLHGGTHAVSLRPRQWLNTNPNIELSRHVVWRSVVWRSVGLLWLREDAVRKPTECNPDDDE
jgi:hypothetical protein